MNTRDHGRVRFCSASLKSDRRNVTVDLLVALEMILPFAVTAPAWAVEAARDAIEQAKGLL